VPIVLKSGSLRLLEPLGPAQACRGIALRLHMTNNNAVSILDTVESNNKIISEYVMNSKEYEKKIPLLSKALTLRIAAPKNKLFQMLPPPPTISKSATYSQKIELGHSEAIEISSNIFKLLNLQKQTLEYPCLFP